MVYLKDLESRLLSTSSERDLSLYRFLNGRKHSIHVAPNDIESELCFNAFVDGNGDLPLEKLRKVQPFKGFHYTNNFVLLIAAAKIDIHGEENNIINYLSSHGHKEQLVLNSALGTNYRIATKLDSSIDILASLIEENKNISEEDIQKSLSSITEIYDLFVLEKAIARNIFKSNEEQNFISYKSMVQMQKTALRRVELWVFASLFLIFSILIYLVAPTIVGLLVNNWEILEPIAYLIDKAVMLVFVITGVVLATQVKSLKNKIKWFVLRIVYRILGVDYSEYQKLTNILNDKKKNRVSD